MKVHYIILFLCITTLVCAQVPKGNYFEAGLHFGHVLKHTSKIIIPISQIRHAYGAELSWEAHTYGKKVWQEVGKYPRMGFVLSFQDFGDARLGWGLGIMPHINLRFFKKDWFEMYGRLALGFSYVSKRFDSYSNPENNIIGSHINNNTGIRIGFGMDVGKHLQIRPSFSFTHYSNAAAQFPNLGINVTSFHLGFMYKNNPIAPEDYIRNSELPKRLKFVQFSISSGGGIKEVGRTLRGPKFFTMVMSIDAGLFLVRNNRLKLGLTHEYNPSLQAFYRHNGGYTEQEINRIAHGVLFYVEDEILLGHLGLIAQIGYYATRPTVKFPFTRIGFRYYPLDPLKHRLAPYIGLRLKSHMITAEYFDLTIGVAIR